jgi:hypothetical protein
VSTGSSDPTLAEANRLRLDQVKQGAALTGGLPGFLMPNPYALPGQGELDILGEIGEKAGTFGDQTALETEGLSNMEALGDPSQALDLARSQYEQYAAPMIRNEAILRGQGRQGAIPEALAGGFASMALPILQSSQQARGQLAQKQLSLGPELLGRGMTGLETQLRTAAAPREALSAEYMRPLSAIANIIGGIPMGGGSTSTYQTGQATPRDTNYMTDVIVPLVGAGLSAYGRS